MDTAACPTNPLPRTASRRGYLNEPFRVFQLSDQRGEQFEYHSHEFEKIILFSGGRVTYRIEGRTYILKPGDVLLIRDDDLHSPLIDRDVPYHRTVIWVSKEYLERRDAEGFSLDSCFERLRERRTHCFSMDLHGFQALRELLTRVIQAESDHDPGWPFLKEALFVQALVLLNRAVSQAPGAQQAVLHPDPEMGDLLTYIGEHLSEPLKVRQLADRLHLSPSHLMHRFKEATGFSVHQYLILKRLAFAKRAVLSGKRLTEAALEAGFSDYSTFLRAFRKHFGISPRDYFRCGGVGPTDITLE